MKFKFNFCCICSDKQNELHNLSNSSSNDLSCYEKLLLVIPEISYTKDQDLQICGKCRDELNVMLLFRSKCLENMEKIGKIMSKYQRDESNNGEILIDIEKINENHSSFKRIRDDKSPSKKKQRLETVEDLRTLIDEKSKTEQTPIQLKKKNKPYECCICQKAFKAKTGLESHQYALHITAENPPLCKHCNKQLQTGNYEHTCTYKIPSPHTFTCTTCQKNFKKIIDFRIHAITHFGLEPLMCQKCNVPFDFVDDYNNHKTFHQNDEPILCSICNTSFVMIEEFKEHQFLHTTEHPYLCPYCGKKCKNMIIFKVHLSEHFKINFCNICKERFNFSEWRGHQNMHARQKLAVVKGYNKETTEVIANKNNMETDSAENAGDYIQKIVNSI